MSVVCFEFDNWSKKINDSIINRLKNKTTLHVIPGNRRPLLAWIMSSAVFFLADFFLFFFPRNIFFLSVASNKRSWLLMHELKKIKEETNLVIGHNPGSFYPAMVFAKKNKIPFGIDLEDYHAGEETDPKKSERLKELSRQVLPRAAFLTAASPLILKYTLQDTGALVKPMFVILNYFPSHEFVEPTGIVEEKLQLVWFSQYISYGRGLEEIIPAIKNLENSVVLHLFGKINPSFFNAWCAGLPNIVIHEPLRQQQLHKALSGFDIGLAIENPSSNLNRDLCITNKILSYQQAGLYILASPTQAQQRFLDENENAGTLVPLFGNLLEKALEQLYDQKQMIRSQKINRYGHAKGVNWEAESHKLAETWSDVMP